MICTHNVEKKILQLTVLQGLQELCTINRLTVVTDNCQCSGDLRGTPSGNHMPMPS
jgi:hypothetical protein